MEPLDPQEVVEAEGYEAPDEDPTDPEVTDPSDPNYVEPGAQYDDEKAVR